MNQAINLIIAVGISVGLVFGLQGFFIDEITRGEQGIQGIQGESIVGPQGPAGPAGENNGVTIIKEVPRGEWITLCKEGVNLTLDSFWCKSRVQVWTLEGFIDVE